MSILNLNTPQGRGPVGKKSVKIWMGVGLLAAVLGFGSTLAANIQINGNEQTEFGQGVAETVFCGGNEANVVVRPFSRYQNTVIGTSTPEISEVSFMGRYVTPVVNIFNSKNADTSKTTTISGSTSGSVPRWDNRPTKTGWWLSRANSDSIIDPQPTLMEVAENPSIYYFAEEYRTGKYYKASLNIPGISYSSSKVITTAFVAAVESPTIPASFRMAGVSISDIPEECEYVDFVLSAFGETGTALTLISGNSVDVKEVAYKWSGLSGSLYTVSKDRNSFVSTDLVTANTTADSLTFVFNSEKGTALSPTDLKKIVIETQEDVFD
jgi:hypothetical protein